MEEKILEQLTLEEKGYTAGELYDLLHLSTTKEFTELVKALNKLEDELKVYHTKKDRYMLFKNSHQKIGILLVNKKGFGFVNVDNEKDIYVKEENLNHGIHGDKVVVEVTSKKGEEPEGRIVRIIERNLKQFVGEYYTKNKQGYIKLDDEKVKLTIEVDKELSLGAVDGHKVLVKLQKKLKGNCYKGQILKILGHRLFIETATIERQDGEKLNVSLNMKNDGIAPIYTDTQLAIYIYDENGSVVSKTVSTDFNPQNVLPEEESKNINLQMDTSELQENKKYTLCVGLEDKNTNTPMIELAMEKYKDKVYKIGEFNW